VKRVKKFVVSWHPAAVKPRPSWPITLLATSLGAGLSPKAPGTMGTLTAIPLAWALSLLPAWAFFVATVVVTAVGTFAASRFVAATGTQDDQRIVIDEVAGYLLTLWLVPKTWLHLGLAFVLFRVFDIWKPQPVRWVDDHVHGGWGVMADDLAAGVYAALVLFALDRLGVVAHLATWMHR
jgi:phosphatidylglycerophosphatase A